MSHDLRIRVDDFFSASKTLVGPWAWYNSERVNVMKFRREVAEDGVQHGFRIEGNAILDAPEREFRFLVIGLDECVCRLDCAPTFDGVHINGPKRPMGFPFQIEGHHFHPWAANRSFSTPRKISENLPYAIESPSRFSSIQQGFRVFCDLIGLTASGEDEPDWPKKSTLL